MMPLCTGFGRVVASLNAHIGGALDCAGHDHANLDLRCAWRPGRAPVRQTVVGLLFAVVGSATLAHGSNVRGGDHFILGALLAVRPWAIAANLLIGGAARQHQFAPYAALAYGWAAVWLVVALLVTRDAAARSPRASVSLSLRWRSFRKSWGTPRSIGHCHFLGRPLAVSVLRRAHWCGSDCNVKHSTGHHS